MTELMDAILQNLQVARANRKKAMLIKRVNNYTSKVEKSLIANDFLSRFSLMQR